MGDGLDEMAGNSVGWRWVGEPQTFAEAASLAVWRPGRSEMFPKSCRPEYHMRRWPGVFCPVSAARTAGGRI